MEKMCELSELSELSHFRSVSKPSIADEMLWVSAGRTNKTLHRGLDEALVQPVARSNLVNPRSSA